MKEAPQATLLVNWDRVQLQSGSEASFSASKPPSLCPRRGGTLSKYGRQQQAELAGEVGLDTTKWTLTLFLLN